MLYLDNFPLNWICQVECVIIWFDDDADYDADHDDDDDDDDGLPAYEWNMTGGNMLGDHDDDDDDDDGLPAW